MSNAVVKELYRQTLRELSLDVLQSRVNAVMKKAISKSGCRWYQDGRLGLAGTLGEATEATWQQALAALDDGIAYPYAPSTAAKRVCDLRQPQPGDDEAFVAEMEAFLAVLRQEFPDFIFSNRIRLVETGFSLSNDAGLDYMHRDQTIEVELLAKEADSLNIFDTFIGYGGRTWDRQAALHDARQLLQAHRRQVSLPAGEKLPVVLLPGLLLPKFSESLNGEMLGRGTSLFCGKMQKQVFNRHFHLCQDRTPEQYHTPFFDLEGVVNAGDRLPLIERGVLLRAYTDKRNAAAFSLPLTGAAGGAYDEVPSLSAPALAIPPGEQTLQQLLRGEPAVLVLAASGGDFTNQGDFASPVQTAYLTDGVSLLGRLPDLHIAGNLFDLFGEDYIGLSSDRVLFGERALAVRMTVR